MKRLMYNIKCPGELRTKNFQLSAKADILNRQN